MTGNGAVQSGGNGGFEIYVTLVSTGATAPTAGNAVVILEYFAPNDGACSTNCRWAPPRCRPVNRSLTGRRKCRLFLLKGMSMSASTQAYLDLLGRLGIVVTDCQRSFAVTGGFSSLQSTRVMGRAARFTSSPATGTAMLPSIKMGEVPGPIFIINDGLQTIAVYSYIDAAGNVDTLNGTAPVLGAITGRSLVGAGVVGIYTPEGVPSQRNGQPTAAGGAYPGTLGNWTAAVFA